MGFKPKNQRKSEKRAKRRVRGFEPRGQRNGNKKRNAAKANAKANANAHTATRRNNEAQAPLLRSFWTFGMQPYEVELMKLFYMGKQMKDCQP